MSTAPEPSPQTPVGDGAGPLLMTGKEFLLLLRLVIQDERDITAMTLRREAGHLNVAFGDGALYALSPDGRLLDWRDGDGSYSEHPVIVSGGS